MRADRLVALLLLLQAKGRVTAAGVAEELEISERTARRDLEALAMAGIPVYSQPGRNGGWSLLGGARTDLTGLTEAEARALFLVAGPSSSATPAARAALRKLVAALPETFREQAHAAARAVVVDPSRWGEGLGVRAPEHLDAVREAVVDAEQIEIDYAARSSGPSTRVVHPLGVVAKGSNWYLVADTSDGRRMFRIDRVTGVRPTGERAERPDGFDLEAAWAELSTGAQGRLAQIVATCRCDPGSVELVTTVLGARASVGPTADDGRVEVSIPGSSVESLAAELAGFGAMLEVIEPEAMRPELARIGAELVQRYG